MINLTQDTVGGMFDKYADMVYRIALNIVKSREEAQDIVMGDVPGADKAGVFRERGPRQGVADTHGSEQGAERHEIRQDTPERPVGRIP